MTEQQLTLANDVKKHIQMLENNLHMWNNARSIVNIEVDLDEGFKREAGQLYQFNLKYLDIDKMKEWVVPQLQEEIAKAKMHFQSL